MTRKQYEQLKQAARRDAARDPFGVGLVRLGDYIVAYTAYSGYNAGKSPIISRRGDFYQYVSACRKLAQLNPGTAAGQAVDCKAFLEAYKK